MIPLLLTGPRGAGKTALLAKLTRTLKDEDPRTLVLATLGDEVRGRDLREVVRAQCLELRQAFSLDVTVGHEWGSLLESFRRILVRIPDGARVLLIVDGLEQLRPPPPRHFWQWLPWSLKPTVRWVLGLDPETAAGPTVKQWLRGRALKEITMEPWTREEVLEYARARSVQWPVPESGLSANLEMYPALYNPLFLRLYMAESALSPPRRPFTLLELLPYARRPPTHEDFRAVYLRLLERWEEDFDARAIRELLMLPSCARDGLSFLDARELMQMGSSPAPRSALWERISPHLSPVGRGRYRPVAPLTEAVRERYSIGDSESREFHRRLWKFFRAHEHPERRRRELAWQAAAAEDWRALEQSLVDRDLFRFLWGWHRPELLAAWELLLQHRPEALREAYAEVLDDPRNHFLQLATVARLHGELGRREEAMALLHQEESLCRQNGALARLAINLGYQATLLELDGNPRGADQSLRKQEEICSRIGDLAGFTNCLKRRGILLAALGEFAESISLLGKLLQLASDLGNRDHLAIALDVQSQVLTAAGMDAQARTLSKKLEEICRASGNVVCLAHSLGRQAALRIAEGELKSARALLDELRPLCEWVGDPIPWAQCLANLALVEHAEGNFARSLAWLDMKERVCRESGDAAGVAATLASRAGLLAGKLHQPRLAMAIADDALTLAKRLGMPDLEHQLEKLVSVLRTHLEKSSQPTPSS